MGRGPRLIAVIEGGIPETTVRELSVEEGLRLSTLPPAGAYNPPWLEKGLRDGTVTISDRRGGGFGVTPIGPGDAPAEPETKPPARGDIFTNESFQRALRRGRIRPSRETGGGFTQVPIGPDTWTA